MWCNYAYTANMAELPRRLQMSMISLVRTVPLSTGSGSGILSSGMQNGCASKRQQHLKNADMMFWVMI
jgi:hypothetical protein